MTLTSKLKQLASRALRPVVGDSGWTLPDNWFEMSEAEQNSWSLTMALREAFPDNEIKAVFADDLSVDIDTDGEVDLEAVRQAADEWTTAAYGTKYEWSEETIEGDA